MSNDVVPAAGRHGATAEHAVSTRGSALTIQSCLALLLLAAAFVSLTMGRFPIAIGDIATLVVSWVGIGPGRAGVSEPVWRVIELVRVPRILVAAFVGAGLAVSGAVLQGIFRNPLVDPHIIGVSSGAAFGGVLAILFGLGAAILWSMAFAFGLAAVLLVIVVSRKAGHTSILMLVLAGVVISAMFAALVSLATYFANPNDTLPAIVFWLMGSFASATPGRALLMLPIITVFAVPLLLIRFRLNVLSLGEEEAQGLGIRVEPTRWLALACVAGITAASVANTGMIGWVGLVVPHFARAVVGPDHRQLLPAAAMIGASYMLIIDTIARTLISAELPLGVLTALIGAPIFVLILHRTQNQGWQ